MKKGKKKGSKCRMTVGLAIAATLGALALSAGVGRAGGFNTPIGAWSYNTAGQYIYTNTPAAGRQALSAVMMSSTTSQSLGATNSIWVTLGSSTNWHQIAGTTTATNTLMFLDGTGGMPLEVGAKIRFQWMNTNAIVRTEIVTRAP